ncbi:MAG: FAD-dependent oxidoreductase [Eubacterium sp.]|nr:FAD-dependent oxidoreductase [Eubacterium sp.]
MIIIRDTRQRVGYKDQDIRDTIKKFLKLHDLDKEIKSYKILKESLDSRRHDDIHFTVTIGVFAENESKILKLVNNNKVMLTKEKKYVFPHILNTELREFLDIDQSFRPVIIGSGPAGYHAAVKLSYAGFKPIVLERGKAVEDRAEDVERLWEEGKLEPDSNICFGEGGAGTFSDGKLNTGNKDKAGYFKEVLDTFAKFGMDEANLYRSKPHIGTDELRQILINMRHEIERLGGEVRFSNKLIGIDLATDFGVYGYETELPVYELTVEGPEGKYKIITHSVILAVGHSARDTFKMLYDMGFEMEKKPFAMGVRVEHKADTINKAMYGEDYRKKYGDKLPAADYKLTYHTKDDERSVFSFCMCPGGYVVNSSTEEGSVCINGMSYSGRDGDNSNSAIVVNVTPDDYKDYKFNDSEVLGGIAFQRELEKAAYTAGNGSIPVTLYKDMTEGKPSSELGNIKPEIKGSYCLTSIKEVLPDFIYDSILEAMPEFGRRIKGYDDPDTVISAVEARTSSPVKVVRDERLMAPEYPGIFPAGEGAGYAGGITSAAADGIKAAEAVSEFLIEEIISGYKDYEISKYT